MFLFGGWAWWYMPIILSTWEVEIRRITVPGQRKKKHEILSTNELGVVTHACNPLGGISRMITV
jgi:hypothetical protein